MAAFEETSSNCAVLLEGLQPDIDASRSLALSYASSDVGWEDCWHKHGIVASKKCMDGNKICIRGQTTYPHSPLELFKVIQNLVELDEVIKQHDHLRRLSPTVVLDHIFLDTPWPVTPRDGFSATFIDVLEDGTLMQVSFGCHNHDVCPPLPGIIRSELAISCFVLRPDGQGGTAATYVLQMDPMGSIPAFLKAKISANKPLILHALRSKVADVAGSSEAKPPATLQEAIEIFNLKPITSL